MFYFATAFNQNLGSWNTAAVSNMGSTFAASAFNQNVGGWNTARVQDVSSVCSLPSHARGLIAVGRVTIDRAVVLCLLLLCGRLMGAS
jgi:surface protein